MTTFSTGVPGPKLSHPFDQKRIAAQTATRRSLIPWSNTRRTSGAGPIARIEANHNQDHGRNPVEGYAVTAGNKSEMLTVRDVMSADVISVSPLTPVHEIAELMDRNRISSVPVVDSTGRLLGLVGDDDLIRRVEIGTEPRRTWWRMIFHDAIAASYDYVRAHGRKARDVMTLYPLTVAADESLRKVAKRMSRKRVRQMPVVRDERVVGMLTRSDLVRALASRSAENVGSPHPNDDAVREHLMARIRSLPWNMSMRLANVTVSKGIARIYGWVTSDVERRALNVVAENTPGVVEVRDHLLRARPYI